MFQDTKDIENISYLKKCLLPNKIYICPWDPICIHNRIYSISKFLNYVSSTKIYQDSPMRLL